MAKNSILGVFDILNEYSEDIQEGIKAETQAVAKEGVSILKSTSPKRTGSYRKGWRVKTTKGSDFCQSVIHNATDYQLTHLLEKPHLKRNGGYTSPQPHIAPVETKLVAKFESKVDSIIRKGG